MSRQIQSDLVPAPRFKALLDQCVRCGLCLPACPTYALFGTEMDSPRGRIALMCAASEGRAGLDGAFREHIALCLSCRACEPACPSGVQYGALIETTRIAMEASRARGILDRATRWLFLRELLPFPRRLRLMVQALRAYQASGLQSLVRRSSLLAKHLRAMDSLLPPLPTRYPHYRQTASAIGERHGRVAFFLGCVQDALFPEINAATTRVLQRNGYDVHFPARQTCCGAVQLHVGEETLARDLARTNIDAFHSADDDAVISNAGGCGAVMKEYAHLFEDDPIYRVKAKQFAGKVRDISEFLSDHLNVPPTGALKTRAAIVDSCHLRNAQHIIRQPRDLLEAIPGLKLIELSHPDRCCGSAGIYNVAQAETANALLNDKMADIAANAADTIVTTNTGCHLQLLQGVRRSGLNARVVHLVELLYESYAKDELPC